MAPRHRGLVTATTSRPVRLTAAPCPCASVFQTRGKSILTEKVICLI
ncbi:Hypothetical protein CAP_7519 [Chondromyces apiculatus DSM 436]|uniref:Uncharacterized protein n=1 Tax=Chondromyces apiculatus DSM 436 TaxID=1192034 RepID=A0A017SZQ0_9BACT|nr:Hypothetical protein CAP_7519 [Chondromyces apiculatus DSM 436]